ncbi:MAG: amylo-alpha-1,6-glucosidase [Candidatus Cloacimonetes bacterium]|nr:amylo-alpha-1,6-glucosidase [Candidatus Cloacimonadota bacterium]
MADYFMETQAHEWILSAQNGAYALGTGNLLNQRKYNGLLVKSDSEFQRIMLVSGIEEEINWRGDKFFIDSAHYSNCIYPEGFLHLVKSWLRPYPVFLYSALPHNEDILIKKEIMMHENSSTVLIKYTNLGSHTLHFKLRPKFAMRNHHHLNELGIFDKVMAHSDFREIDNTPNTAFSVQRMDTNTIVFGWLQHGKGFHDKVIFRNVFYPWDAYRGYQATEDLIAPLGFEFELKVNETNYLMFSDKDISESPTTAGILSTQLMLVNEIEKRYSKLPEPFDLPGKKKREEKSEEESILTSLDFGDNVLFNHGDYMKILEQSMKDFLANDDIIAGFPWFGAWGRDTMISLEGVLRLPKGAETAFTILEKYAKQIKNGLIPNMCGESHQQANYVSIDATLWFLLRLYEVCKALNDGSVESKKVKLERLKYVIKLVEEILEGFLETKEKKEVSTSSKRVAQKHIPKDYFIRDDGLLELSENFAWATWMDAKVYDMPVTPRNGAPVEINALLFNGICAYEMMIEAHNTLSPDKEKIMSNQSYLEMGAKIKQSFNKFWIGDFLSDRIVGEEPIREYRPNALIATSLPFTDRLLTLDKIQQVYDKAHTELFTPYGIRSLSAKDFKFKRKYIGGIEERDKAYHQGTVWGWLLLPFAKTYLWANPFKPIQDTVQHLAYLVDKLRNGYIRGHIASVAEVWDGDKPHFPKGCPAQAWSVSAIYCIECIIMEMQGLRIPTATLTLKNENYKRISMTMSERN